MQGSRLGLGASRFGGSPDVPAGFAWPKYRYGPLTFIAQIDLSAVRAKSLPRSGWLLFFYDAFEQPLGFDPEDAGGARVIYIQSARTSLTRVAHPVVSEHIRSDRTVVTCVPFEWCSLSFSAAVNVPQWEDGLIEAEDKYAQSDAWANHDRAAAAISGTKAGAIDHHMLGHPRLVQGDMRKQCQLVTNGINYGDPSNSESRRAKTLLRGASAKWQLLLQVDTDEKGPGWMWGDCGRLYYWIRHTDLAARSFEKAWLILQCC